jgi:hypothetical protein
LATLEAEDRHDDEAASAKREGSKKASATADEAEEGSEPAVAKSPSSGAAP